MCLASVSFIQLRNGVLLSRAGCHHSADPLPLQPELPRPFCHPHCVQTNVLGSLFDLKISVE